MVHGIAEMLEQGEGLSVEFKRCGAVPEKDTFETVCSFANRQGGHILLGVNDDGSIEGVDEKSVVGIERNIVNVIRNPTLFNTVPGGDHARHRPRQVRHRRMGSHGAERLPL